MSNSGSKDKLNRKRAFYDTFANLESNDDEQDAAYEVSKRWFAGGGRDSRTSSSNIVSATPELNKPRRLSMIQQYPRLVLTRDPQERSDGPSAPPPSAIPRTKHKRKGQDVIILAPPRERLFEGLQFYFFPNNDANPARRLRIIKSLEYGASWQIKWNKFVTHVIVDLEMDYNMLLSHLHLTTLPASVVLVNESWPAACLMYRSLVGADHKSAFVVRGRPALDSIGAEVRAVAEEASKTVPSVATDSLVLKAAGKAVLTRPPSTPTSASHSHGTDSPGQPRQHATAEPNRATANTSSERGTKAPTSDDILRSQVPNELLFVINEARDQAELPLDEEDDDHRSDSFESTRNSKFASYQDRFQCMQAHTGEDASGINGETIQILQRMADHYQQTSDEWRTRAYRKVIATLRNLPYKVTTKAQALALPNIGERLAEKIEEIVVTHRLRRLDEAQAEPTDKALQLFLRIYGVGHVQASNWVSKGYKSVEDLLSNADLTHNQRIGIEHMEDFNLRIPRAEVKRHGEVVERALRKSDADFSVIVGGSYRRGQSTSGDIDCVITHPRMTLEQMRLIVLDKVIAPLTSQGFLKAELSVMSRDDGSKWHGASCLPDSTVWRRIDFLLVPADELGAAMIYFTGNDIFNRSVRLLASKKGMRLNQHGLYKDVIRGKGRERLTTGTLLEGHDERRIFEILGVPWREPHERLI